MKITIEIWFEKFNGEYNADISNSKRIEYLASDSLTGLMIAVSNAVIAFEEKKDES
jgi:hypothetical protein